MREASVSARWRAGENLYVEKERTRSETLALGSAGVANKQIR